MSDWDKKRDIMRRYNLTAHIYDMRYAEEQAAKIEAALETVKIDEHSIILDAGCGTGILVSYTADKPKVIVGLDISKGILLEAKEHAKKLRNAHFVLADADNMPLRKGFFSHVFGVTLIQNMPNPARALDEIKRVARKDTVVIVTGMKKAFALEEFERLLRNAGLEVKSLKFEGLQCYVAVCTRG
jgi:ubiquinone/menaquinone biosynthesis C-methylase UbiE